MFVRRADCKPPKGKGSPKQSMSAQKPPPHAGGGACAGAAKHSQGLAVQGGHATLLPRHRSFCFFFLSLFSEK
jgi:hypothetical protein